MSKVHLNNIEYLISYPTKTHQTYVTSASQQMLLKEKLIYSEEYSNVFLFCEE
jgi:hypothetical protein